MTSSNRRDANRRKTIFGGVIYGNGEQPVDCRIVDMSETGVRLRTKVKCEPKSKVFLRIFNRKGIHQCELKWSEDGMIGLKFVSSRGLDVSEFNKTFNLLYATDDTKTPKESRISRLRSSIRSSIPAPRQAFA